MIRRLNPCDRFSVLSSEANDRTLSSSESRFVESHRLSCEACADRERSSAVALDLLRGCSFGDDINVSPHFDERLLRKLQITRVREGIRYWSPAALGAGIACVALFAALHLATAPVNGNEAPTKATGQARNMERKIHPNLELRNIPELKR